MRKNTILAAGLVLLLNGSAYAVDADNKAKVDADKAKVNANNNAKVDADNTAKNERDKDGGSLTVFDQGGSEADRNITATVRKSIVDNDKLSMNAHNVKIITVNGVVTLRGPVDNATEKSTIETVAKSTTGVTRVDSQLEVQRD